MSRPNIEQKFDWAKNILIECECRSKHYLELLSDRDEKNKDDNLYVSFIETPNNLWQFIRGYFRHGRMYHSEVLLGLNDAKALREYLDEHIKYWEEKK